MNSLCDLCYHLLPRYLSSSYLSPRALSIHFLHTLSFFFPSSVLLRQSLVRRRRSGLAVTSDLWLPVLQEVLNLSGQTLEPLLKICLHGPLKLARERERDKTTVIHIDFF